MQDRTERISLNLMLSNAKVLLTMASKAYDGTSTGLNDYNRYKRGLVALISVTFNESYEAINSELSGYYPAEQDISLVQLHNESYTDGGVEYVRVVDSRGTVLHHSIQRGVADEIYPYNVYIQKRDQAVTPDEWY